MHRSVPTLALLAVAALAPAVAHADDAPRRATHVYVTSDHRIVTRPATIDAQLTPDDHQALGYCRTGGTMTFRDGGVELATVPVDMYCAAHIAPALAFGQHAITVDFSGNDQYLASSGSLDLSVPPPLAPTLPGAPTTPSPAPVAPAPDPDPTPAPAPVPAPVAEPAPVGTPTVRAGLAAVRDVSYRGGRVAFAQTIAAPGTIRWTLSRGDGSPALGSWTATVTAGSATGTFRLSTAARRWLRTHPKRKLLLRTVLTLSDGRAIGVSQRLTRPRA